VLKLLDDGEIELQGLGDRAEAERILQAAVSAHLEK
jgi:hypothetical protein